MTQKKIEKNNLSELKLAITYLENAIQKQKKRLDYHTRIQNKMYNKRISKLDALVHRMAFLKKQNNEKHNRTSL